MPRSRTPDELRAALINGSTRTESGCLEWQGVRSNWGYGRITHLSKPRLVHRLSYELNVGPIPEGLDIDHLCRNRACIEPAHLEPVTRRENNLRATTWAGINAPKTHCPQNHPYDEANTYRYAGRRHCRKCRSAATLRHYHRSMGRQA